MRRIDWTHTFRRDFRRVEATPQHGDIDSCFQQIVRLLSVDAPLPARYVDHRMKGKWKGFRDCHIKHDLVLIYRKRGKDVLELVRLGSHSELGI
ncbi:MAG TPA: type II toxin-antitoxin system YafQ family toxin [Nitrosospira sp.]|nr:type II toxin-antitoxin system YafQ family toxin [Nitrosospira sp.]